MFILNAAVWPEYLIQSFTLQFLGVMRLEYFIKLITQHITIVVFVYFPDVSHDVCEFVALSDDKH
jgi:hypothetical protein